MRVVAKLAGITAAMVFSVSAMYVSVDSTNRILDLSRKDAFTGRELRRIVGAKKVCYIAEVMDGAGDCCFVDAEKLLKILNKTAEFPSQLRESALNVVASYQVARERAVVDEGAVAILNCRLARYYQGLPDKSRQQWMYPCLQRAFVYRRLLSVADQHFVCSMLARWCISGVKTGVAKEERREILEQVHERIEDLDLTEVEKVRVHLALAQLYFEDNTERARFLLEKIQSQLSLLGTSERVRARMALWACSPGTENVKCMILSLTELLHVAVTYMHDSLADSRQSPTSDKHVRVDKTESEKSTL